jgi:IPT/TIG domain
MRKCRGLNMRLHSRWLPVAASTLLLLAACDDRPGGPSPVPAPTPSAVFAISSIFPAEGFGGQRVLVSGTGFIAGATLTLGGLPAGDVSAGSAAVTGTIPPNPGGPVDVVVTNPDGRSATRTGGFTYLTVSLTVSASAVGPGEPLSVSWAVPGRRAGSDWIGLFGVGVPSTSFEDGWWEYTGSASGTMTLTAPGRAGDYEFRYLLDDGYFDVARAAVAVR